MRVDIVFAEFGDSREHHVPLLNVERYFPGAEITIVTQDDVEGPFDKSHPRYGYRMNDFWKVQTLVESKADIAISFDADIKIVSDKVESILDLTDKFGLCLPCNPRRLVYNDTLIGADSDYGLDSSKGMGYAVNMTPIAFKTSSSNARRVLDRYLDYMLSNPVRGPLNMWRAIYDERFFPCLLPPQWCVCSEDIGIGSEIILHTGHEAVRKAYEA